jgi:putative transcriptional regulator
MLHVNVTLTTVFLPPAMVSAPDSPVILTTARVPIRQGGLVDSLKGQLLISSGGLYDPNFRHTVVLIGEHDENGAVGVVVNIPLDMTVEETVPTLADLIDPGAPLFQGGPVEPRQAVILAEMAVPGLVDVPVFGSVGFLTGEVSADVRPEVVRARIFLGHAGWGPGQLEAELEVGSWIVEEATPDDVFSPKPDTLWSRVLERKGPPYTTMARIPYDPSMN